MTSDWHEWRRKKGGSHVANNHLRPDDERRIDAGSLLAYVLTARVDLLAERTVDTLGAWKPLPTNDVLPRKAMARHLGLSESQLSHFTTGKETPSQEQVMRIEHKLMTFAYRRRGFSRDEFRGLGWLTAYAEDLLGDPPKNRHAPQLARWHTDLAQAGPQNSAEALMLGEALLGLLGGCASADDAETIWERHREKAQLTVRGLVAVTTRPPGGGAMAATNLAAECGAKVLPVVREHLLHSPVGFRTMRIVFRLLELLTDGTPNWWSSGGQVEWIAAKTLLNDIAVRRVDLPDPYPGRSLYAEAVRESIRAARTLGDAEWERQRGPELLRAIAGDPARPRRERVYAAACLTDPRVYRDPASDPLPELPDDDEAWRFLRELRHVSGKRSLTATMLDWAKFADYHIAEFELIDAICERATTDPTDPRQLGYLQRLPQSIQRMTLTLIRIALASPDGVSRRRATDALKEAGVTNEVSLIVGEILRAAPQEWLQEMCAFVLGQLGDPTACPDLEAVAGDELRSATVRHAALFSLADLRRYRPQTIEIARQILVREAPLTMPLPLLHGATYALAVLRPIGKDVPDPRQLPLLQLLAHPDNRSVDDLTRSIAAWGVDTFERVATRDRHSAAAAIGGLYPAAG